MLWILIGLLAVFLIALLAMLFFRKGNSPHIPAPIEDLASLSITQARIGDTVLISGAGDDFSDLSFTIDRKHGYESAGERWFEVSGLDRGRRVFLEIAEDDVFELLLSCGGRSLSISDVGLDEQALIQFDESPDEGRTIEYDGSRWRFEDSGEIIFHEHEQSDEEGFYCWNFREEGTGRVLCVEKWEGQPFEVTLSEPVEAHNVSLFRA